MRVVPDLSLDADPWTGFLIGETQSLPGGGTGYAEVDYGGTSLASPLFAGLVADGISEGALARGFLNPTLYDVYSHDGSEFFDDVQATPAGYPMTQVLPAYNGNSTLADTPGSDELLTATAGYDDATGLGMPTTNFLSLGDTGTTLSASQNPVLPSAAPSFTATVAPTAQPSTAAGEVQFYIDGAPAGAPVALSGGSATSAPISGLAVGHHNVTAAYAGDATQGFLPSTSAALSEAVSTEPTRLSNVVVELNPHGSEGDISAALTRTDTNTSLAGQAVSFASGGTQLCSAATSAAGVAICTLQLTPTTGSLLAAGVTASFAGTKDYIATTATASLPGGSALALPATSTLGSANGTASLTLTCIASASDCGGTAELFARSGKPLGQGSFSLASGRTQTITLRLNQLGRGFTAAAMPLAGRMTITSSAAGATATPTRSRSSHSSRACWPQCPWAARRAPRRCSRAWRMTPASTRCLPAG